MCIRDRSYIVKSWAAIIGPINTAVCQEIFTIEFAFKRPSFSICVGRYALNAGTIGNPKALWKNAIKTITQTDFISKKKLTKGLISDGDLRRFSQKNLDFKSLLIKDVMTKNPITVDKDVLAAKALSLMNSKKITSLHVFSGKHKFKTIGVLSIHNILQSNIS